MSELTGKNVVELLVNKTSKERDKIKSLEICKFNHRGVFDDVKYGIRVEIIRDIQPIEINGIPGIEIFAKAWKGAKPLGFGENGSVEIERFRIFNPPILVDDPNGTVIREMDKDPEGKILPARRLREDPIEAIRQSIAHTISLLGKENTGIVIGKIGNIS